MFSPFLSAIKKCWWCAKTIKIRKKTNYIKIVQSKRTLHKHSQNSTSENEENRAITVEESKARRVELGNINTSKEFELKIGEKTYSSISAAQNAGYLKKDSKGYYIDLTKVERSTDVDVTYWVN